MHLDIGAYRPAGETLARFHASSAFVRLIAGPVGSAKTTACCWEAPFTVMLQKPGPDGVRRAKVGMVRDTYRNLYGTTLKTWFKSFPRDLGDFVGSDDRPFLHKLSFPAPYIDDYGRPTRDAGLCELEVEGKALGEKADVYRVEALCRGWELLGCQVDEIDTLPQESIAQLKQRTQRYGDRKYRVSRGIWGAFNKPDTDHWIYEMCVERPPPNFEFFDQPAGLLPGGPPYQTNPDAENLENLDEGYYITSAEGEEEHRIRRFLRNQWGASVAGDVIYPMFKDRGDGAHVLPQDIWPKPRDELWIGMDGGGTPAATIAGRSPTGRIITYAELVVVDPHDPKQRRLLHGVGPRGFGERLRDLIQYRFPNNPIRIGYCDPAAFYGADRERGEYAWPEIVQNVLADAQIGCAIQPAPSNEIALRLEAVRTLLTRLNDVDGQPEHQINPSCRWLRRGFVSDYKYEQRDPKQPGKTLNPQKSATSHVHDAEQYQLLGMQGRAGVTAGPKHDRGRLRGQASYGADPMAGVRPFDVDGGRERDRAAEQAGRNGGAAPRSSYATDFDLWGQ